MIFKMGRRIAGIVKKKKEKKTKNYHRYKAPLLKILTQEIHGKAMLEECEYTFTERTMRGLAVVNALRIYYVSSIAKPNIDMKLILPPSHRKLMHASTLGLEVERCSLNPYRWRIIYKNIAPKLRAGYKMRFTLTTFSNQDMSHLTPKNAVNHMFNECSALGFMHSIHGGVAVQAHLKKQREGSNDHTRRSRIS